MSLRLIIVDDEYLIRQLIRSCIDWEAVGIEVVGEFASAAEALRQMEFLGPDIVLTDICMPDTNGLQFAEQLKEQNPAVKIIAITGYDSFEYAKRAIHIGIDGYILKPINTEELMEIVVRVRERIVSERSRDSEMEGLSAFKKETEEIVREYYLTRLLESEVQEKIVSSQFMEELPIEKSHFLWVGVLEYIDWSAGAALTEEIQERRKNWLGEYCERNLKQAVWVACRKEHFVILDTCEETDHKAFLRDLAAEWRRSFGCALYCGSDTVRGQEKSIHAAYLCAAERLSTALINSDSGYESSPDQHVARKKFSQLFSMAELRKLQYCIESDSPAELREVVAEWFGGWDSVTKEEMEFLRVQLLNTLFYLNTLNGSQDEETFQSSYMQFYDRIGEAKKLSELRDGFADICAGMIGTQQREPLATDTSKLIYSMKQYIRDHLDDPDLSLVTLAQTYYLNSSYLSRIFKKEVRSSFIEYLIDQRIEKAKELLRFSSLKSYEVGERVGIYNANYFGILFKKKVGVTPVEYRKQYSR